MVRKLKHHEQKLLRKVDFTTYKGEGANHQANTVIRRYGVQNPADYTSYNRLCGDLRKLAHRLTMLPPDSAFRLKMENNLLEKCFDLGLIGTGGGNKGKLSDVEHKVTVSAFCRRRLNVVLTRLRMAETIKAATTFIESGNVRVGSEVVTDPSFLVSRNMEDFVTWVDSSKIKRSILKYRDKLDDFDLL